MARRRKILNIIIGVVMGISFCAILKEDCVMVQDTRVPSSGADFGSVGNTTLDLLLVGVMTAEKYLHSRAKTVYETWGKEVPGRVLFFSSEYSRSTDIPLVPLKGIDDSYPPQKKSFAMLKYMHDHFIDDYEWFLRADDDVYIRADRLEGLLRSVDSRKAWFIGQTGRGNNDEFGLLSLEENENFCMGGPGVLLSKETLRRIAPNIDKCLENLYTTHEDVELGRCVRKFAGVPCTWSYEMQVILYHNQSGEAAFSGDLKQKEVHRAITMHPVKHPQYMARLHNYIKGLKIQEKQQQMLSLHRDVVLSLSHMEVPSDQLQVTELIKGLPLFAEPLGSENYLGDPEVLGAPVGLVRYKPKSLGDVLDWELISKSLYSSKDSNPKRRIGSSLKEGLGDIIREVMELINLYSKQRGRVIDFREILYGYWRLDPLHGADLVLDMSLTYKKYRGHKMTVPVRRHAYIQQTFTGVHIREVLDEEKQLETTQNFFQQRTFLNHFIAKIGENLQIPFTSNQFQNKKRITFILPLSGRHETFIRFLNVYEEICIKEKEPTRLLIVLYRNRANLKDFTKSLDLIKSRKGEIDYKIIEEEFSRGKALQYGVDECFEDDLLFFVDVDVIFNHKSLQRIRLNTVRNKKIYFPIVYSLYNPNFINNSIEDKSLPISELIPNNKNGFWRQFGFGITSIYKSDFLSFGGFNTSIVGWGLEDVSFFDKVIKSKIKIVRSVDTDLIHMYHPVKCDYNLEQSQREMCTGTKANLLGPLRDLQDFYKKYKYLFR